MSDNSLIYYSDENETDEPCVSEASFVITADDISKRIDVTAAERLGMTRSAVQKLIEQGKLTAGGKPVAKNYKPRLNDTVTAFIEAPKEYEAKPENIPLDIVFEDDSIIVINKPQGMVVHPAAGHESGTLVNALLYHCGDSLSGINGVMRPGIVHRIDMDTSGLIAVAKNDKAHTALSEQLRDHSMHREYLAIVNGGFRGETSGTVDAPIGRHPVDRKKMAVITAAGKTARNAVTHYEVLSTGNGFSLVRCVLETGRTHQIRVHMAYIGHPLAGDELYGGGHTQFEKHNSALFRGQCLHAYKLILRHPDSGELMTFSAPAPDNFIKLCEKLGFEYEI